MTEHDDTSSVEDASYSADQAAPLAPTAIAETGANPDRVQQLIREKQSADTLAQRSLAEAAALRERVQQVGRAQDYRAPEDFTRAVAENAVREAGADLFARQAAQAQDAAARASQEAWAAATADFRSRVQDFDAVAHNPNLPVTPVMADAIRESARGAEVAYYLGKNPDEAAQIAALPPLSQATAIARLESRLGSAASPVSKAPQPVGTLSGRGGSGGKRLEDMNFEDYRKARGF